MGAGDKRHRLTGVVVLAAGGSTRMGCQKLLLELGGKSILSRCVESALSANADRVIVVAGNDADRIIAGLQDLPVLAVRNEAWRDGLSSSIACGVRELADYDAAILVIADQPFVAVRHLNKLIEFHNLYGGKIVASSVDGVRGNPTLFSADMFPALVTLRGDEGARQLFSRYEVHTVAQDEPLLFHDMDDMAAFEMVKAEWLLRHGT